MARPRKEGNESLPPGLYAPSGGVGSYRMVHPATGRMKSLRTKDKDEAIEFYHAIQDHFLDRLDKKLVVQRAKAIAHACGIYFLVKDNEIVYVGKSKNIHGRVSQHFANKEFDSFTFIEVRPERLDQVERTYIRRFRPKYNIR